MYQESSKVVYQKGAIQLAREEMVVRRHERINPFRNNTVEKVIQVFEGEGIDCKLGLTQVKRAFGALGVQKELMQDPDAFFMFFINSFEINELYPRESLITSCILLSNSKTSDKLQGLFCVFDQRHNRILTRTELETMMRVIYKVSVYNFLFLVLS